MNDHLPEIPSDVSKRIRNLPSSIPGLEGFSKNLIKTLQRDIEISDTQYK
jgi:hypothetical protein